MTHSITSQASAQDAFTSPPPAPVPAPKRFPLFEPSVSGTLQNLFGFDLRSLALFRINFALVFLWDLWERATALRAHYTEEGVLPLNLPSGIAPTPVTVLPFSLHNLCDDVSFQAGLFLVSAAAAVALLVGYRTRLMTLLVWFLLLSTQARNPMLMHAGDVWMRVFLFWSLFLPLGAVWSVDARLSGRPRPPSTVVLSAATFAFLLQLCFVYLFAVLWKTDPAWRTDGTAVSQTLRIDSFATPLGLVTRQYPGLMKLATFTTFYVEAFGPILLLLPFATQRFRLIAIALFVGLHLGIGLNMSLGNFAPVCIVTWLALLPPWFWDRLRRWSLFRWPAPGRAAPALRPLSEVETAVVLFCLAYVLFFNLRGLYLKDLPAGQKPAVCFHDRTIHLAQTLGLDQGWGVFAPKPGDYYGWYILRARLQDGSLVDLHRGGRPVTLDKPPDISALYVNSRWRRYLDNLHNDSNLGHRQLFAAWAEREWNRQHPDRKVQTLSMLFVRQNPDREDVTIYHYPLTPGPDGQPLPPVPITPDQVIE